MSQGRILHRGERGRILPGPQLATWSTYAPCCTNCGTTERKHKSRGLCRQCYAQQPQVRENLNSYRRNQYHKDSEVREKILRASKLRNIYGSSRPTKTA